MSENRKYSLGLLLVFLCFLNSCQNEAQKLGVVSENTRDSIMDMVRDSLYGKSHIEILKMLEGKVTPSFLRIIYN